MESDVLYHLALDTKNFNLTEMFSDVKFVCMGGSPDRMKKLADRLVEELPYSMPTGHTLCNIAGGSDRYVLYKVGPVLTASHGMGVPSLSIILHELFKLLHHAQCEDVIFFRVGSSGGIGVPPGSVVVSESVLDGLLHPHMSLPVLGEIKTFPAYLNSDIVKDLVKFAHDDDGFKTYRGKTLCANDFYEGQGRLDGAFCEYTKDDKMDFLKRLSKEGVLNIEMEAICFAAMCLRANVKAAVVCATLVDRLQDDQLTPSHDTLVKWILRPETIVLRYIKSKLKEQN
ncbi:uridine phosphorylase 2-like isoform X2 [Liolophura sinensis]